MDSVTSPAISEAPTTQAPVAAAPTQADSVVPAQVATPAPAATLPPDLAADKARVDSAIQDYQQTAAKPVVAAPVPGIAAPGTAHSRLLNMISGLALGADAFGKAIATHGREGGVQEVAQANAQKQAMQQSAQQAAQAQRNAELQMKLTTAQTNEQLMQSHILLAKLPQDLTRDDLLIRQTQQGLATSEADFRASHFGMSPTDFNSMMSGTGTGGNQNVNVLRSGIQQKVAAAAQNPEVGANDQYVKQVQAVLANPNATPTDLWTASQQLDQQINFRHGVTAAQTAQQIQQESAPFGAKADALNAALLNRYRVLNPGAKSLPAGYALSADSTPKDFDRIDKIMQQTESAQGTAAQRATTNAMRQQTLALTQQGNTGTGDSTKSGQDYIATLTPGRAAEVKAIGEGRVETNSSTFRTPAGQSLLADVTQAYPSYDQSKGTAYSATRKDFTSGKTAQGINSLNTVANHLSRMYDHTSAASTLPGVSGIARAFGSEQAAALKSDKQAVATELAKAYANGQISEGEVKQWNSKLDVWSPLELRNNIKEISTLLDGKLTAYQNQWNNGMPTGAVTPIQIVSPAARASLDHISGKDSQSNVQPNAQPNTAQPNSSNTVTVTDPRGVVHTFPDQASANRFRQLAGIR